MRKIASLLLTALVITSPLLSANDQQEKMLVQHIDKDMEHANRLLQQVVDINSGTMNFEGVRAVGRVFEHEFSQIGFATQWVDGQEFNRSGHFVASYGSKGPKILMIGHLDTVFAKNDPFQKYQKLDNNRVKGPGITDMKGGDVIILYALRALKALGLLDNIQVKVVMTGDEERSGNPLSSSKKALIDAAKWADIALGFEDGDGDIKTAVVSRRGASGWSLNVTGKPAHSSQIFRKDIGDGAIFETARILEQFRTQLANEPNLTFNPGIIIGGTTQKFDNQTASGNAMGKNNIIAKTVRVNGDIRAVSPEQLHKVQTIMKGIVANSLPHTSASIEFEEGYPPMAASDGNRRLLMLYDKVSQDLGFGTVDAVNPRKAGAADISFAANHVEMALDGLGLMGTGGHTKEETADMSSFPKNIKKAAILMYRLANKYGK